MNSVKFYYKISNPTAFSYAGRPAPVVGNGAVFRSKARKNQRTHSNRSEFT